MTAEETENARKPQQRGEAVRQTLLGECEKHLIAGTPADQIKLADILDATGVARATVYHHFGDLEGMIGQAALQLFGRYVEADLQALNGLLLDADSIEQFVAGLTALTRVSQSQERSKSRLIRTRMIAYAITRPNLASELARLQNQLTDTAKRVFSEAQTRGWIASHVSPHALAVFIQAYSLGRIVDDIADDKVNQEAWVDLIDQFARSMLKA